VAGAAAATICIFLPSILIVVMLSPAIDRLRHRKGFDCFITGILCSFVGLLVSTVSHFSRHVNWSWGLGLIAVAAFAALCARMPILAVLTAGIAAAVVLL
jgi:chromate transport protein ChrA